METIVTTLVNALDVTQREEFEERAGIIEFEGRLPRPYAESLAILDVLRRHPTALTGVTVIAVEVNGAKHCLLTTDAAFSRRRLKALGGKEIAILDLKKVVEEEFRGLALLTPVR